MHKEQKLLSLLGSLREATKGRSLDSQVVVNAMNTLEAIDKGFKYNLSLFPRLPQNTPSWNHVTGDQPSSLAEALLWKMGKWKIYQQFCKYYAASSPKSKGTDVVFYAFARHLKDKSNPIYDQHALRALWCIDEELSGEERGVCKRLLVGNSREKEEKTKKQMQWKPVLGGATHAKKGYALYCRRLRDLCRDSKSLTPDDLDKLLMPLGQAIKKLISASKCLEIVMLPRNGSHGEVSKDRSIPSVMTRRRSRP